MSNVFRYVLAKKQKIQEEGTPCMRGRMERLEQSHTTARASANLSVKTQNVPRRTLASTDEATHSNVKVRQLFPEVQRCTNLIIDAFRLNNYRL